MSKSYSVVWEINLDADSHKEAAELALAIQRSKNSTALLFEVTEEPTGIFSHLLSSGMRLIWSMSHLGQEMSVDLLENNDE